jgi:murein DD-endopeptidase / murein LD-carboxypeptidase
MADRIVARARDALGAPFRLHGRDAATGLDCVGLAALAFRRSEGIPTGYALRGGDAPNYMAMLRALRFTKRRGNPRAGDLLLLQAGPTQFHLGLWTGESLIHADAQLRCVVELPGMPPWPLIGAWHRKGRKG